MSPPCPQYLTGQDGPEQWRMRLPLSLVLWTEAGSGKRERDRNTWLKFWIISLHIRLVIISLAWRNSGLNVFSANFLVGWQIVRSNSVLLLIISAFVGAILKHKDTGEMFSICRSSLSTWCCLDASPQLTWAVSEVGSQGWSSGPEDSHTH